MSVDIRAKDAGVLVAQYAKPDETVGGKGRQAGGREGRGLAC